MGGVVLAAGPDLVKQKCAGLISAAVQIVLQATFFLAGRSNEGAELGFEEQVLALLGAKQDDEREGSLWEFGDLGAAGPAAGPPPGGFLRFSHGHVGGDCTPNRRKSNLALWDRVSVVGQ